MNTTLSDIGTAILLVFVATALFVWFCKQLEAASRSRLRRMMASFGLCGEVNGVSVSRTHIWYRLRRCA